MKSYFAVDNTDCSPDGPIVLGSILKDPADPEETLNNPDFPVPMSEKHITRARNFEDLKKANKKGAAGLWFKILDSLGLEVSGSAETVIESTANYDNIETWAFQPSPDYMKSRLAAPEVQDYLEETKLQKPIYIVTGIKIAYGARVSELVKGSKEGKLLVGYDGSTHGVPVGLGPRIEGIKETNRTQKYETDSPFVFAYRLREILFEKGKMKHQPYRDGATYSVDGGDKPEDKEKEGIFFVGLGEDDLLGDDVGLQSVAVVDDVEDDEDDDECELVLPANGK